MNLASKIYRDNRGEKREKTTKTTGVPGELLMKARHDKKKKKIPVSQYFEIRSQCS